MSKKIIQAFGGVHPMAAKMTEALGGPWPPTTIYYWSQQGYIPIRRQPDVIAAAAFHSILLDLADFAYTGAKP